MCTTRTLWLTLQNWSRQRRIIETLDHDRLHHVFMCTAIALFAIIIFIIVNFIIVFILAIIMQLAIYIVVIMVMYW